MRRSLSASLALGLVAVATAAGAGLIACGGGSGSSVALVAFSTPREAYEELIPKFNETDEGAGVHQAVVRRLG